MQQVSKTLTKQSPVIRARATLVSSQQTQSFSLQAVQKPELSMASEETKHRVKLPLYDLYPRIENCWVAPNSTIGKCKLLFSDSNGSFIDGSRRSADQEMGLRLVQQCGPRRHQPCHVSPVFLYFVLRPFRPA